MSLLDKHAAIGAQLAQLGEGGDSPFGLCFEQITSPTEGVLDGKPTILFGTNNYLGLTFDRDCVDAAVDAARRWGTGSTGSRNANGSYAGHLELEAALASFFGRRHVLTFSTGYQANLGAVSGLVGRGDHLFLDADSHASLYDAAKLSGAEAIRFRHNDPEDLAKRLGRLKGAPGGRLVVVEGIYSMMGDVAPLKEMVAVKREFGASLLIDEAHSLGMLGERGRGAAEAAGVEADVDFIVGTFSKSLGGVGGFCVSDEPGFEVMRVVSRPYMFSASLPPSVVASTVQALKKLETETWRRRQLMANARQLYEGLNLLGFETGLQMSPIVAATMPDMATATGFWRGLLEAGIYVNIAAPPATPTSRPLLRLSVSAVHTSDQIDVALAAFARLGQSFGLLSESRRAQAAR